MPALVPDVGAALVGAKVLFHVGLLRYWNCSSCSSQPRSRSSEFFSECDSLFRIGFTILPRGLLLMTLSLDRCVRSPPKAWKDAMLAFGGVALFESFVAWAYAQRQGKLV